MKTFLTLFLFLIACQVYSQKVKVKRTSDDPIEVYNEYLPFGLIERQNEPKDAELLATIKITDGGFSADCSWETILALAKKEAREIGGNCLFIEVHKFPDRMSTCHRLHGKIFKVPEPRNYEKRIEWNKFRKLEVRDFQADTSNKPFIAATYSSFQYQVEIYGFNKNVKINVHSFFTKQLSYFKETEDQQLVLAHEQRHFDITEIFARKFFEELSKMQSFEEIQFRGDELMATYHKMLLDKQAEYDSEVYKNWDLQDKWNEWVDKQLMETSHLASKSREFRQ